jgi:hypothetical protein
MVMPKMKTIFSSVGLVVAALIIPSVGAKDAPKTMPVGTEFARKLNIHPQNKKSVNDDLLLKDLLEDTDKIINQAVEIKSLFENGEEVKPRKSDAMVALPVKLAKLNILNKITGQSESVILETGMQKKYGTLHLRLYDCVNIKPPKQPDATALLEISESSREDFVDMSLSAKELQVGKKIFFGWMFASSPAVSSLEHPVYDITVKECGSS